MSRVVDAAGALLWRRNGRTLEVLLIHRPAYDDWSWPKGKPAKREMLPACAIREVKEETGLDIVLGVPLPSVRYTLADGRRKVNHYWAARVVESGTPARPRILHEPGDEVDQVRWVDAVTALTMLTRRSDRQPLIALLDLYADERLETWAVLITRHGAAKKRAAWTGGELTRPLTPAGVKQADRLVPFFDAYGVGEVHSSTWGRCTTTVEPFTRTAGLALITHDALTEEGAGEDPKAVKRLLRKVLRNASVTSVVCTHRPVLPTVLEVLRRRAPYRVQEDFPQADPYLRPGEVLVAHVAPRAGKKNPRIIAVESHRAPRG